MDFKTTENTLFFVSNKALILKYSIEIPIINDGMGEFRGETITDGHVIILIL